MRSSSSCEEPREPVTTAAPRLYQPGYRTSSPGYRDVSATMTPRD